MEQATLVSSLSLWIIVLFNLLLTLVLIRRVNTQAKGGIRKATGLDTGIAAPNFTAEALGGEQVSLSTYNGRPMAFLFIGTRCGPCREAIPRYESIREKALANGTELVLVSIDNMESTQELVQDLNVRLPVIVAPRHQNPFADDYKVSGTPSYCIIDGEGKVHSSGYPNIDVGKWKALDDLQKLGKRQRPALVSS